MPDTWYLVAALTIVFAITLALRALPFTMLKPLRESAAVQAFAVWMPAGVLAILAASTLRTSLTTGEGHALPALVAVGVTVAAHLAFGRRTLLSVGLGTAAFVLLVNLT